MITSLAHYITGILCKNHIINSRQSDVYIYGFEIMISGIINIIIGLTLGIIFSQVFESILFLIAFIFMRKYCGGYHADTYFKCNSIFLFHIFIVMSILKINFHYSLMLHSIIGLICITINIIFAPVDNQYKPLNYEEKNKYKKIALFIGLFFFCSSSILYFHFLNFCIVMDMALGSVAISMIIEKLRKGCDKSEKSS